MFTTKGGAYPRVEPFRCSTLGQAPGLTQNIRLGWKSLVETNTLAYYKNLSTKKFYKICSRLSSVRTKRRSQSKMAKRSGANVTKLFCLQFTDFRNKLECLSLASLSSLFYCLRVRPGAYSRVDHLKGSLLG